MSSTAWNCDWERILDHAKRKIKGVKVTRKVKIVKRNFCIKKTHTFTIIAMNFVQEQLKIWKQDEFIWNTKQDSSLPTIRRIISMHRKTSPQNDFLLFTKNKTIYKTRLKNSKEGFKSNWRTWTEITVKEKNFLKKRFLTLLWNSSKKYLLTQAIRFFYPNSLFTWSKWQLKSDFKNCQNISTDF